MNKNLDKINSLINDAKALIFDADGTLLDSLNMWNDIDYSLIKTLGGEVDEKFVGKQRDMFLHKNNTGDIFLNYAEFLKDKYNPSFTALQVQDLRNELTHNYLKTIDAKDGVMDFLIAAKNADKTLCLATLSSKWVIDIYLNSNPHLSKFNELFDIILTKEDVTLKKPDPEIYNLALKKCNVEKSDAVVFEDSFSGVLAAKNAGIAVVKVEEKNTTSDELAEIEKCTDLYLESWHDLATPQIDNSPTL